MSYKDLFFEYGSPKTNHDYAWLAPRIFEVDATNKTNGNFTSVQLVPAFRVFVSGESSKSHLGIAVRSWGPDMDGVYGILDTLHNTSVFGSREMIESKASRFDGLRSAKDRLTALVSWAESASVAIKEGVNSRNHETLNLRMLDSSKPMDRTHFHPSALSSFFSTDKSIGLLNASSADQADKLGVATRPVVYYDETQRYTVYPMMICRTRPIGASPLMPRAAAPREDSDLPIRFCNHESDIPDDDLKPIATMLHSADVGDTHKAVSAYRDKVIDLWCGFATENGLKMSGGSDATAAVPPQDEDEAQWGEWKGNVGSETEFRILDGQSQTDSDREGWGPWRSNTGDAEQ